MKGILEFLAKNNRWAIVLVVLLFIVGGGLFRFQQNKIKEWKNKHQTEVKLRNALIDTVGHYKNAYGEEVAEKLTLQTSVENLEDMNDKLTVSQQELLARVKIADNENSIITAALIEAEARIDSLLGAGFVEVNPSDSTITFSDSTEFLMYDITVGKVVPAVLKVEPTIMFNSLRMPNKQFVEFHWKDNKKEGYPIEFSVSNSNKYFHTYNINSYAIPKLDKNVLNPTGWQKVGRWFTKNGKVVGFVAGGVVVGAAGTYILMQ
jgi:hypothetical protein